MRVLEANGINIHHAEAGGPDRPPLVFVNSLGTDFRAWQGVVERLGGAFRIVLYDKRGHGLSDATPAPYAMDDHVADLAALLDRLDVRGAVVCGISVGGMIAQGLAAAHPERVGALVLCDTGHKIGARELWDERIATVEKGGVEAIADGVVERWFSAGFRVDRPAEVAGWRNMLVRTPADGYLGTCAAIRDADLTELAKGIKVPTLCLCGTEDVASPPALVEELAGLIPGARYAPIEGAAHLPCIETPGEVASLIGHLAQEAALG